MRFLAEDLLDQFLHHGDADGATDEDDFVDVLGGEPGVLDGVAAGALGARDEGFHELLELGAGELDVEMFGAGGISRDEGEVDVGFLRGGEEPDREFQRVLKIGRRSERWINLFGRQRPLGKGQAIGSIDQVLEQAEAVVIEQYKKGRPPADESVDENKPTEDSDESPKDD